MSRRRVLVSFAGLVTALALPANAAFTPTAFPANWSGVASSADGTRLAADGAVYTSSDAGMNWTARTGERNWSAVASSAAGTRLVATVNGGRIYVDDRVGNYYVRSDTGSDTNDGSVAWPWQTIGYALTNMAYPVAAGDAINVASGTYTDNLVVATPVTLRGPNAGKAWDDPTRGPEAILYPATNETASGVLIRLQTNHVTIDGFLLDGDNPDLGAGFNVNEADANTAYGVMNGVWTDHFTFDNNVLRNIRNTGVYLDGEWVGSYWNYLRHNLFTNIWNTGSMASPWPGWMPRTTRSRHSGVAWALTITMVRSPPACFPVMASWIG